MPGGRGHWEPFWMLATILSIVNVPFILCTTRKEKKKTLRIMIEVKCKTYLISEMLKGKRNES